MKRSTTLTPAFIKKIKKAHTTTTRFNWRVIGTSGKTNNALRFVLHNVPQLLNDWTRLYKTAKNGTSHSKLNGKRTARNTKTYWNGTKWTTRNKRNSTTRWSTKTGARLSTNAKRNTRTKNGTRTTTTRRWNGTTFGKRTSLNTKRSNGTKWNTRNKRNTGFTTLAKNGTKHRFSTNGKRTNKNHFTTNAKRFTNAKRTYRTRRAA